MNKITNPNYRKFLDTGMIDLIDQEKLEAALIKVNGIRGKYIEQARAMLITMYFTGARPSEVLDLKGNDFEMVDSYMTVRFLVTRKRGVARTIYLPERFSLVKEVWKYTRHVFPAAFLFFNFRSNYKRQVSAKDGNTKQRADTTARLRYYFKKWFDEVMPEGIPPYYLRHNGYSQMSQAGATMNEIMLMKGGKSLESARPYIHMSSKTARELSKKIK